jgi:hypothetical protein
MLDSTRQSGAAEGGSGDVSRRRGQNGDPAALI